MRRDAAPLETEVSGRLSSSAARGYWRDDEDFWRRGKFVNVYSIL